MSDSHLVLGGARSGKSRRALALCEGFAAPVFLATAEAHDAQGHLNQALAGVCAHVEFVVAGLPMSIGGRP